MSDGAIPPNVEQFLNAYIASVAHLEALLLLRGEPEAQWTEQTLADRLFITREQSARVLADLTGHGFFTPRPESAGAYRYKPPSRAMADLVDQTAETYRTRLVAVTQLIHARQTPKIQHFADAFRFRKD